MANEMADFLEEIIKEPIQNTNIDATFENEILSLGEQRNELYRAKQPINFINILIDKLDQKKEELIGNKQRFRAHPLTHISLFLGLPTRNFTFDSDNISMRQNFLRNLFRWHHPSAPAWQKAINYFFFIAPLLAFSWHLLKAIPSFVINVTKLISSIFLGVIASVADTGFEACKKYGLRFAFSEKEEYKKGARRLWAIPLALGAMIGIVTYVSSVLAVLVMMVVTAPYSTITATWSNRIKGVKVNDNEVIPKAIAIVFMLIAAAAFTLLAIYGLPILLAGMTSLIPVLPAFMATGLSAALSAFTGFATLCAPFFAPIGAAVTSVLGSIAAPAFASTLLTNAVIGLAAITGFILPFIGIAVTHVSNKLSDLYYNLGETRYLTRFINGETEPTDPEAEEELSVIPNVTPGMFPQNNGIRPQPTPSYNAQQPQQQGYVSGYARNRHALHSASPIGLPIEIEELENSESEYQPNSHHEKQW